MANRALFLDRDGTINVDKDYLFRIEEFEFVRGAIEALAAAQNAGFKLIVITNQSGIARGYYTEEDFHILNDWMLDTLKNKGISISAVYYCPHHPNAEIEKYRTECECRKPKLGLYYKAVEEFDLDLNSCYAIGDKIRDCCICEKTGCQGFLIGDNEKSSIIDDVKKGKIRNVTYATNLYEAVQRILM